MCNKGSKHKPTEISQDTTDVSKAKQKKLNEEPQSSHEAFTNSKGHDFIILCKQRLSIGLKENNMQYCSNVPLTGKCFLIKYFSNYKYNQLLRVENKYTNVNNSKMAVFIYLLEK